MRNTYVWVVFTALTILACQNNNGKLHLNEEHDDHSEIKLQYTTYTPQYEVFAEAYAFVINQESQILAHFTKLSDFKPVVSGSITLSLTLGDSVYEQTLAEPTRDGIYLFKITPTKTGTGTLTYTTPNHKISVPNVQVFSTIHQAEEAIGASHQSTTNTTVFTKEQSWKINFATATVEKQPFQQVIKTTALVEATPENRRVLTAKTNGIVSFLDNRLVVGKNVSKGHELCVVSNNQMATNNLALQFTEAKNNFDNTKANYNRALKLSKDNIVSEKELMTLKNEFSNAEATYKSLQANFKSKGQEINSPFSGYINDIFIENGSYVEAGAPLLSVAQSNTLLLTAELPQRYYVPIQKIQTATIMNSVTSKTYPLEMLNGKIIAVGKSATDANHQLPVSIEIDNNGDFIPGSFVDIFLKTSSTHKAIAVPNTALIEEQGIFFVYIQQTPELFEKREVQVGHSDGIKTEIIHGLNPQERLVTKGAMFIKLAQATGGLDAHSGHVH